MNDNNASMEMEYLSRREAQERAAAARSGDMSARRAHAELANHYASRRRNAQSGPNA